MERNININPMNYPTIKCDKCGCKTFISGVILKKIPGLALGTGAEDQLINMPVFICSKCGEVFKDDRELYELDKEEVKEEKPTSNVLIL